MMACTDSRQPVVEKVQQEPQEPWSLTIDTAPLVRQSNEAGGSMLLVRMKDPTVALQCWGARTPSRKYLNSSQLMSENWLGPAFHDKFMELISEMRPMFFLKIVKRAIRSTVDLYCLPYSLSKDSNNASSDSDNSE